MRLQEPLTRGELERLWRWERQMSWFQVASMLALVLASVAAYRYGDVVWLRRLLLGGVLGLVLAAMVLQFRGRCPRCGTRFRSGVIKMLPDKCARCGVEFLHPSEVDR